MNEPLTYDPATVSIEVRRSRSGIATIYDKEIVLYIPSLMATKLRRDRMSNRTSSSPRTTCSRPPAATIRRRLSEAIERLQRAQIKANIEAGGEGEEASSVRGEAALYQDPQRRAPAEGGEGPAVRLAIPCDPARSSCARLRSRLSPIGPIERRIYEVARSTCESDRFDIDLATYRLQIGYQNLLSNFRRC